MKMVLALGLAGGSASTITAQEGNTTVVRVCSLPAPGFFERDAKGGFSGLEYDLLSSFAAAAKVKVSFEDNRVFDRILKDTESGACQIGAATISVTDERKALLSFSTPYFPNRVVVVQKTSSEFTQPADLKDRRVAVVRGTVSIGLVNDIPGVRPVVVDGDEAAFLALNKGEADALACDSALVLGYMTRNPELGIAFPIGERSFFAFALPPGSKLLGPLNEHLASLSRSGVFKKMLAKHFGADNADLLAADVAAATSRP